MASALPIKLHQGPFSSLRLTFQEFHGCPHLSLIGKNAEIKVLFSHPVRIGENIEVPISPGMKGRSFRVLSTVNEVSFSLNQIKDHSIELLFCLVESVEKVDVVIKAKIPKAKSKECFATSELSVTDLDFRLANRYEVVFSPAKSETYYKHEPISNDSFFKRVNYVVHIALLQLANLELTSGNVSSIMDALKRGAADCDFRADQESTRVSWRIAQTAHKKVDGKLYLPYSYFEDLQPKDT